MNLITDVWKALQRLAAACNRLSADIETAADHCEGKLAMTAPPALLEVEAEDADRPKRRKN